MTAGVIVEDRAVQEGFARLIRVGQNPPLAAIGNAIKESTRLRFHDGRGPSGIPWKPVIRGGSPLRNTGLLMNSVSSQVTGNSVFVGVPYFWAAVHQFSATITAKTAPFLRFKVGGRWASKRSVTIPARPIFGISVDDRIELIGIIRRALVG